MELSISARANHDLQLGFAILQGDHLLVYPRIVADVERAVHHARKTHDNMRTKMRVNVRRTELPRRVQVPRYCVVADEDLAECKRDILLLRSLSSQTFEYRLDSQKALSPGCVAMVLVRCTDTCVPVRILILLRRFGVHPSPT